MKLVKFQTHSDFEDDDDDLKSTHIVGIFQCAYIETLCQIPASKGEAIFTLDPNPSKKITCLKCLEEIKKMEEHLKELKKFTKLPKKI